MSNVSCPGCGQVFQSAPHLVGQTVQCPNCQTPFTFSAAANPQQAAMQPWQQPAPTQVPTQGTTWGQTPFGQPGNQPGSKGAKNKAIVISLAVGGGVALLLIIVVVAIFAFRSSDTDGSGSVANQQGGSNNQSPNTNQPSGNNPNSRALLAAMRTRSRNNLVQVGIAMHMFHDVNRYFPGSYSLSSSGKPLLSWRVHLLPFLEQEPLYDQFHLDEPWDSPHNATLISQMPDVYRRPNSQAAAGKTTYLAIGGPSGCFPPPSKVGANGIKIGGVTFGQMTDGTSNTLLVVEASDAMAVEWTKPVEFKPNMSNPLQEITGAFPDGFHILLGDGTARFVNNKIRQEVFAALLTKNGGEILGASNLR